jgi:hypothetical protein
MAVLSARDGLGGTFRLLRTALSRFSANRNCLALDEAHRKQRILLDIVPVVERIGHEHV